MILPMAAAVKAIRRVAGAGGSSKSGDGDDGSSSSIIASSDDTVGLTLWSWAPVLVWREAVASVAPNPLP